MFRPLRNLLILAALLGVATPAAADVYCTCFVPRPALRGREPVVSPVIFRVSDDRVSCEAEAKKFLFIEGTPGLFKDEHGSPLFLEHFPLVGCRSLVIVEEGDGS